MEKQEIINGYIAAEKPFDVCVHTILGGYMEFFVLEKNIMFEDNAKMVAEEYAKHFKGEKSENFKGICVRKNHSVVHEIKL